MRGLPPEDGRIREAVCAQPCSQEIVFGRNERSGLNAAHMGSRGAAIAMAACRVPKEQLAF
eukprot:262286-Prymnesium_polylepis.1